MNRWLCDRWGTPGFLLTASFFFFNDTTSTKIYTLFLHDALPISPSSPPATRSLTSPTASVSSRRRWRPMRLDRKSTRLNSSHPSISYAVFCLKKKKVDFRRFDRYWHIAHAGNLYLLPERDAPLSK